MSPEQNEQLFRLPLPLVKRTTIDEALASLTEQMLINARHSRLPLFAWLAKHDTAFFFGGALCRFALEREAAPGRRLAQVTRRTVRDFERALSRRQARLLELDVTDISQIPPELAPSFSVWKPENPDLMDFLAIDMVRRLVTGGYTPPEIGSAQAGALLTYEISRMQEAQPK